MRRKFYLNKRDGKLMGVCAGLADYTGIDVLWIRIATAVLFLAGVGSLLLAYLLVGLVASTAPAGLEDHYGPRSDLGRSGRGHWRADSPLGDVETYYTTSNPRLSREIDGLR